MLNAGETRQDSLFLDETIGRRTEFSIQWTLSNYNPGKLSMLYGRGVGAPVEGSDHPPQSEGKNAKSTSLNKRLTKGRSSFLRLIETIKQTQNRFLLTFDVDNLFIDLWVHILNL